MAGSGSVQKVQNNIITLPQGGGGPGGAPGGGSSTNSGTEVADSSNTKYYKSTSLGRGSLGMPGVGQTQSQTQVQEAKLADIKVGNQIMVWGTKNGSRITAEVIYIQSQSFGP